MSRCPETWDDYTCALPDGHDGAHATDHALHGVRRPIQGQTVEPLNIIDDLPPTRADRETLANTRQWLATVETHVRDNLDIIYRALQTHSDMIATLNETADSDEALDMVLESAAKITVWHQNQATGPQTAPTLYELIDLARDMYASYATYLHTKDNP